MVDMWAGYMWGENSNYTVSWDQPRTIVADSSIFILTATDLPRVTAWIRSVTVKDPSTGSISVRRRPLQSPFALKKMRSPLPSPSTASTAPTPRPSFTFITGHDKIYSLAPNTRCRLCPLRNRHRKDCFYPPLHLPRQTIPPFRPAA